MALFMSNQMAFPILYQMRNARKGGNHSQSESVSGTGWWTRTGVVMSLRYHTRTTRRSAHGAGRLDLWTIAQIQTREIPVGID